MLQKCFSTLSQLCASTQSCHGAPQTINSTSWLSCCFDMHCLHPLSTVGQLGAFPNHVQSIEFITGGLQSSCRNISRMINGNMMHLSPISSLIAKGLNTYVNNVFRVFIHLQHFLKKLFLLCRYGVLCVDC